MVASAPASRARLHQVLAPVVSAAGLDLEDVEVQAAGRRSVVRVLVDRDGGVTLDDVAEVSRTVSEALDALDDSEPGVLAGAYVLEVGSPGVDRPLTEARHWRRAAGRLVAVTRVDGPAVTGRVVRADDTSAVLDVDGTEVVVGLSEVRKALVQVEFSRPGEPEPEPELDETDTDDEEVDA
ncbi:MAG: ribosome maturation factor RimP [Mycobacteriales bacterium]|nr:ribosome maturation factor RimP [Mycobacteriales bacterium]